MSSERKKIIFFTETAYVGGAEVYLQMLASGLNSEQFDVRVAIPKKKGTEDFVNKLKSEGIEVDFIKKYNILNNYLYFRKYNPDYIHFNVPFLVIRTCTTAMLAGIINSKSKLYVTVHMVTPEYEPHPFIKLVTKYIYSKINQLITVSNRNKDILIKNFNLPENKIKVIYNCIDINYITNYNKDRTWDLKNKFSITDSSLVFGTVARLDSQKGHEYLIDASTEVIERVPDSLFLFVGRGKLKNQLVQQINNKKISKNFRLLGYQDNLPEIFALIDIFVLPSISEGFPFVVLEAMAAKKPVIASNVGGISEIITNNVNGILVEPMDPDALAKAMIMMAEDTKKRNIIAELGYKRIIENFSLEKMISDTKEIYK